MADQKLPKRTTLGMVQHFQHFHKRTNRTLGDGGLYVQCTLFKITENVYV